MSEKASKSNKGADEHKSTHDEAPNIPALALTKNNWIVTQHYNAIPKWDCDQCLAFLSLSETSQHKLPGSIMTTSKVRRKVVERLGRIILELHRQSPESVGLCLDQDALRTIIEQLSTLRLPQPTITEDKPKAKPKAKEEVDAKKDA